MQIKYKNNVITYDIEGESRSEYIKIDIYGIKKGYKIDFLEVQKFVDRRKSGKNPWSTPRKEDDIIVIKDGLNLISNGIYETTGEMITLLIYNKDVKNDNISDLKSPVMRPGHADWVSYLKYGKVFKGGGIFSGRMMALYAALGGIVIQILNSHYKELKIAAYIASIGDIRAKSYEDGEICIEDILSSAEEFRLADNSYKTELIDKVMSTRSSYDSVGGFVECIGYNIPDSLGEPISNSIEGLLSRELFSIPAIKSVEFGIGTKFASLTGYNANDTYYLKDDKVQMNSNNNGGINGGITNGFNINFRVAIKATSSIVKPQPTIQVNPLKEINLKLQARNDCCIVPRAVVLVESALAITLLNAIYMGDNNEY